MSTPKKFWFILIGAILAMVIIACSCGTITTPTGQVTPVTLAATPTPALASPTPIVNKPTPQQPTATLNPTPIVKTPTPQQPTATLSPTAEVITLGNILFQDSLASNSNNWTDGSYEDSFFFQDGKSHLALLTSNAGKYSESVIWNNPDQEPRIQDFVLEVEANLVEGSDSNSYGVSFRQVDEAFYFFEISGNGSFRLRKDEAQWTTLVDWTPNPAILTGKRPNALRVVAKGNTFGFYVNGTKVGTFSDSSFSDGTFGTVVFNDGSGGVAHAAFDNLTVWKLGLPPAATMTPAPEEEYTKGEIFFQDDFSDNRAGWKEGPTQVKNFFQDGKYHLSGILTPMWIINGYPGQELRFKDFVLEIEATLLEGSDGASYNIRFRYTDPNCYNYTIYEDGAFSFEKFIQGRWTVLIPKTSNAAIQTGKGSNTLKVVAEGTSFSFFVNGVKVGAFNDDSIPEGNIGLGAGADNQGLVHATFANLTVWELITK